MVYHKPSTKSAPLPPPPPLLPTAFPAPLVRPYAEPFLGPRDLPGQDGKLDGRECRRQWPAAFLRYCAWNRSHPLAVHRQLHPSCIWPRMHISCTAHYCPRASLSLPSMRNAGVPFTLGSLTEKDFLLSLCSDPPRDLDSAPVAMLASAHGHACQACRPALLAW